MDDSRLLRLPAEVRNYIYELVFKQTQPIVLGRVFKKGLFADWRLLKDQSASNAILALPKTCKALRSECSQIFYAINAFIFQLSHSSGRYSGKVLEDFYNQIGGINASALRTVVVDVQRFSSFDISPFGTTERRLTSTLSSIINKVQQELQPLHKTCSIIVTFGFDYMATEGTYDAILDLHA